MLEILDKGKHWDWKKNAENYKPAKSIMICFATGEDRYIEEYKKVFQNIRELNYSIPLYFYNEAVDEMFLVGKIIEFSRHSLYAFPEFNEYIEAIGKKPDESIIIAMNAIIDNFSIDLNDMVDYTHHKMKKECHLYPKAGKTIAFYYADNYTDPEFPYEDKLQIDGEDYCHLAAIVITRSLTKDLEKAVIPDDKS